jgi:Large polyvalent protein-associated domain 7/Relaxase/Mobilisation nuclease domain
LDGADSVVVRLRSTFAVDNIGALYDYMNDREKAARSRLSPAFLNQQNPIPEAVSLMRTAHPHAKPGWHIVASWAGKSVSPETALDAYEALLNEWTIRDHYWGAVAHGNTDRWHVHGFAILQHPESRKLVRVRFRQQQIARVMRDFGFAYDENVGLHLPAGARDAETWNGQYSFARFLTERLDPAPLLSWEDLDRFLGAYGIERQQQKTGFILVDGTTSTPYRVKASSVGLGARLTKLWGPFPEQRPWPKALESYGELVSRGALLDPTLSDEQLARLEEWQSLRAAGATTQRYGYWLRRGRADGMVKHDEDDTARGDTMDGTSAFTRDELIRGLEARLAALRAQANRHVAQIRPDSGFIELTRARLIPPGADASAEQRADYDNRLRALDRIESAALTRGTTTALVIDGRPTELDGTIDLAATDALVRTERILDAARTLPAGDFRLPSRRVRGSDEAQIDFSALDLDQLEGLVGLSVQAVTAEDINTALDAASPEVHELQELAPGDRARLGADLLAAIQQRPTWQTVHGTLAPYGLAYGPYFGTRGGQQYRGGGIYEIVDAGYDYYARPSDLDRKLGINGLEARLGPLVAIGDPRAHQTLAERTAAGEINGAGEALDEVNLAAFREAAARHQTEMRVRRSDRHLSVPDVREGVVPVGLDLALDRPPYTIVARDPDTGRYIEVSPSQTITYGGNSQSTADHYVCRIYPHNVDPGLLPTDQRGSRRVPEVRWDTGSWEPSPIINLAERTLSAPTATATARAIVAELQPNMIGGPQEGRTNNPVNAIDSPGVGLHPETNLHADASSDVVLAAHSAYARYLSAYGFEDQGLNAAMRSYQNRGVRMRDQLTELRTEEINNPEVDQASIAQLRLDKMQAFAVEQERLALTIAMHERPITDLYPKTYAEFVASYSELTDEQRVAALDNAPPRKDRVLFDYDESYAAILNTSFAFDEERGVGQYIDRTDGARVRFWEHQGRFALDRKPQDADIDVALRMADARWGSVTITGDDAFVARAYERAKIMGINIANEDDLNISPSHWSQIKEALAARDHLSAAKATGALLVSNLGTDPREKNNTYAEQIRERVEQSRAATAAPIKMPTWAASLRPITSDNLDAEAARNPHLDRAAVLDKLRDDRLASLVQETPLVRGRLAIGVPTGSNDFVNLTTVTHQRQPYIIAKLGDATHVAKLPPSRETRTAMAFKRRVTLTGNPNGTAELSTIQSQAAQRDARETSLSR